MGNITKLWGCGVRALVSDRYSLRICCLLLCTYNLPTWILESPPYLPQEIILPPRHSPSLSQNLHLPHEVNFPPGCLPSLSQNPEYPICLSTSLWYLLCWYPFPLPPTPCLPHNFFQFSQSCLSAAPWIHHASLLWPPLLYPIFPSYTSNISRNATHCNKVACRLPIYFIANFVLVAFYTTSAPGVSHIPSTIDGNYRVIAPFSPW